MTMSYIMLLALLMLLSSCGTGFVMRARNDRNAKELIAFKEYLDSINVMDDFKDTKFIHYSDADPVMKAFFEKYHVRYMAVTPCRSCKCPPGPLSGPIDGPFIKGGNYIELFYAKVPVLGDNHSIYFDYSEEGLVLKEGWPRRGKVADRIFVF